MTDTKVTKEFIKTTLEQQFKRLADKAAEDSNMSIENMAKITMAMSSLVSDIALLTADNRIGFLNIPSSTDETKSTDNATAQTVSTPLNLDTTAIDEVQEKADKLKASLVDIGELVQKVYYSHFLPDTTAIDDAQKKLDKLKTTIIDVQELIIKTFPNDNAPQ